MSRASCLAPGLRRATRVLAVLLGLVVATNAAEWSIPEQQLSRKIAAATSIRKISLNFENRSSLGRRDTEIIQNGLRSSMEAMGLHFVPTAQAAASITISLSENVNSFVWVAQIKPSTGDAIVVIVSAPRPAGVSAVRDSVPLTLRKNLIWEQRDPILDVAVLEESAVPSRIAVLGSDKISLYRMQNGKWQQEQTLEIAHANPWPRDLRGRLMTATDHLLDIYLPGIFCQTLANAPLSLTCRESSDPWPLVSRPVVPAMAVRAEFSPQRNFFSGAVTPPIGNLSGVAPFYSAASVLRDASVFWILSGVDRQVHIIDGGNDRAINPNWGSDVAALRTSCGAGWQILATSPGESDSDSVRAYEFPERDPVGVSGSVEFPGTISALWTEAKGDTAIAVARNQESGNYEAFRLAMACSQ